MLMAVTISLLTYLLPVSVAIGVAGEDMEIAEGAYPEIADYMGKGTWLRYMLTVGALASNFGTYIAYLTTSAQCSFLPIKYFFFPLVRLLGSTMA
jgi:amino acid transporter